MWRIRGRRLRWIGGSLSRRKRSRRSALGGGCRSLRGGTLLYIKALLEGLFEGPRADEALREELRALGSGVLRAELERVDPRAAERIHPNDSRRTVRAVEVFRLTGTPISELQAQWDTGKSREDALLIGLDWETGSINKRINSRVKQMIERGADRGDPWVARIGRPLRSGGGGARVQAADRAHRGAVLGRGSGGADQGGDSKICKKSAHMAQKAAGGPRLGLV